jgi:AraC-like DNA-binding protein
MKDTFFQLPDRGDPSDVLQLFPSFSLRLLCCRYWWLRKWEFKELAYPYWRIYYNKIAGASIYFEGERYELTPDKIIMIAPNTSFSTALAGGFDSGKEYELEGDRMSDHILEENVAGMDGVLHLFIHFNLGMPYDNVYPGIFVFDLTPHLREKINAIIDNLTADYSRFNFYSALNIQSLIGDLLADVPESRWDLMSNDFRILEVLGYIEKNLHKSLHNDVLARKASMATNAFTRLFTKETGESPQRYVKKKRIENACALLHHSQYTIDDIAVRTGFADRFHFSRIFKRITGVSPARYRREFEWIPEG